MLRILPMFLLGLTSATAQTPAVHLMNLSRPLSRTFQVGDRFEIQITGAPGEPISVRTVRQGTTDWGPVIASTDSTGRWSATGQFEKSDFGGWSQMWTVGGKLATPAIQFDVMAPCLPGGRDGLFISGQNMSQSCDTTDGPQTFVTPSLSDSFRTPDGRTIPGRRPAQQTPEQYHMQILTYLIGAPGDVSLSSARGGRGDETADLIGKMIGPNALTEKETQNVLAILRAAFARPQTIAPGSRTPTRTLVFLGHLAEMTDQDALRQQIADTIAYLQAH